MKEKYRVKEYVGTGQFVVQKRFQTKEKIENPKWFHKFYFWFFGYENENEYEWINLNVVNSFSQIYYTKFFDSFDEAKKVVMNLKEKGEEVIHIF